MALGQFDISSGRMIGGAVVVAMLIGVSLWARQAYNWVTLQTRITRRVGGGHKTYVRSGIADALAHVASLGYERHSERGETFTYKRGDNNLRRCSSVVWPDLPHVLEVQLLDNGSGISLHLTLSVSDKVLILRRCTSYFETVLHNELDLIQDIFAQCIWRAWCAFQDSKVVDDGADNMAEAQEEENSDSWDESQEEEVGPCHPFGVDYKWATSEDAEKWKQIVWALNELGLEEVGSFADIKRSYREQVKRFHPDRVAGRGVDAGVEALVTEKFKRVCEAYRLLKEAFEDWK